MFGERMTPKSAIRLLLFAFVSIAFCTTGMAQATGTSKERQPVASPYAAEESRAVSTSLGRRDLDLRAALSAQPDSPELLFAYALLLREEGKARDSLTVYTRAAAIRKPTADELRSVALDYVLLSDYDDAIHWLEKAEQMDPKNTSVLYSLGRCYYSKDRFPDARKLFEQILAIDPHNLKAEENLGLVYDSTNEPEKAEESLRTAVSWADASGTDEWPFMDLGGFLLDHDRPGEALDPLRTAVRIKISCASCHEKLGRALLDAKDVLKGIAELEQATQLDPTNPRTHYELGRALRQAGEVEKARKELSISQKLYSTHSQE
jgi:tetratricopeptide (TPR) repeat protein